jgi:hypothetical protein
MRKKTTATTLSLTVIAAVIAFCWIKFSRPTSGRVALGLQSYTNASAVVWITNRSFYQVDFLVMVERKIGGEWPTGYVAGTRIPANQFGSLRPRQLTNLTIPVMVYAPPYPWRVSVFYTRPPANPNSLRFKASVLAFRLGMRKLCHKLRAGDLEQRQVSTPEMEQWEK